MSPHPYRLAMSCLDTPPVCEPPKKRHFPIEALILACAFVAAGSGIATLHAVGHGGHVEIGPAALAHLKKSRPKPVETKPRPRAPRTTTSIAQAPFLRGNMHDPKALLATARQLQALGLDLTIDEIEMARPLSPPDTGLPGLVSARIVPVYGPGGHVDGVELHGVPPDSVLRAAGVADGDQILGINGYDFVDSTFDSADVLVRSRAQLVVEISRGHHHVVLSIRWPVR